MLLQPARLLLRAAIPLCVMLIGTGAAPHRAAPHAAPAAHAVHTVVVDKMVYAPAVVTAHVGDTIEWVNRDMFHHSATAKGGAFDLDLPVGKSARTVVTKPGTVAYACKFHPGMTGRIEVSG